MIAIILLLSVSMLVALCFLGFYIWSVKTEQFTDDYSPSQRILFEDKLTKKSQPKK